MNYIEFDRLNSLNEFALNSNKITLGEYEQQKEVLFNQALADERAKAIDELQKFAQWLWDSHYLVDEAFTIRLVEQYTAEQIKGEKTNNKQLTRLELANNFWKENFGIPDRFTTESCPYRFCNECEKYIGGNCWDKSNWWNTLID